MNTSKRYEAEKIDGIVPLKLNCFSLLQNGFFPSRYTSDGININPSLYIDNVPNETKTLAVIVEDPDVPHGNFCHWVAWNIPVTNHIKEKENRGVFGINDFCNHGYNGPHPFSIVHRYHFKVYALDCILNIPVSSTKWELKAVMKNHMIGFGIVTGKYQKQAHHTNGLVEKIKPVFSEELKTLLNEKSTICVSIILPLHDLSASQRTDKLHLSKAIKEVNDLLSRQTSEAAEGIVNVLRKLQDEIILQPNDKGIGIYVSQELAFYTTFPFEVTEKKVIDKSFHLKELLVKEQYSLPYTLVYIDEKEIRLYNGKTGKLSEVKNEEFPMCFAEALEIQLPLVNSFFARNTYLKSFDRNKNEKLEEHHKSFLRTASEKLHSYIQNSEVLILCGVRKYLSEFMYHTGQTNKPMIIFYGNYSRFSETDFAEMVWPSVKNHIDEKLPAQLNTYYEKLAEGKTEEGILHVWNAIICDRGETLLIEKNFEVEGFIEHQNPSHLYLHAPKNPHAVLLDAVDAIIKMALEKDIKIVFVEDGMLNRNMRIALVTKF